MAKLDFKNRRSNYMMTAGDTLRFKYTKEIESKKIEMPYHAKEQPQKPEGLY